jgi:hypothetical protein
MTTDYWILTDTDPSNLLKTKNKEISNRWQLLGGDEIIEVVIRTTPPDGPENIDHEIWINGNMPYNKSTPGRM